MPATTGEVSALTTGVPRTLAASGVAALLVITPTGLVATAALVALLTEFTVETTWVVTACSSEPRVSTARSSNRRTLALARRCSSCHGFRWAETA